MTSSFVTRIDPGYRADDRNERKIKRETPEYKDDDDNDDDNDDDYDDNDDDDDDDNDDYDDDDDQPFQMAGYSLARSLYVRHIGIYTILDSQFHRCCKFFLLYLYILDRNDFSPRAFHEFCAANVRKLASF